MKKLETVHWMDKEEKITWQVPKAGEVSDGYHTFNELYEHRIILYIALCRQFFMKYASPVDLIWKSKQHNDGSSLEGWFLLGMETVYGQISYHLPDKYWDDCYFAIPCFKAPPFDGYTSQDVLNRITKL